MTELPTGDAKETESADAALAGPDLRFLAVFFPMLAIIVVIAAITMPILRDQRIQANESATIGHIRKITGAQVGYSAAGNAPYVSFAELTGSNGPPVFLLGEWYDGVQKDGYIFTMKGTNITMMGDREWALCYEITASPAVPGRTGKRYFFSDCSGVIRANEGTPADSTSPPIPEMEGSYGAVEAQPLANEPCRRNNPSPQSPPLSSWFGRFGGDGGGGNYCVFPAKAGIQWVRCGVV